MSLLAGSKTHIGFAIDQTTLIANTSLELVSPVDGWIDTLYVGVQTAVTTGGTITVLVGTGPTTVAGLTATIANSATKGTSASATSTAGSATRKVLKGNRIQVKPTSFATAGALWGGLVISSADTSPL